MIEHYGAAIGPMMPPAPFGTVMNPIGVMEREHVAVKEMLAQMRDHARLRAGRLCLRELPRRVCVAGRAGGDLVEHIRVENEILHRRAGGREKALRG